MAAALYEQIEEVGEAETGVNRLCQIAGRSRAGYYRFRRRHNSRQGDMDSAQPDPACCAALAVVRLLPGARRSGPTGLEDQSQTRSTSDAERQLTLYAAAEVHLHHGLATRFADLLQLSREHGRH
jgi:hypothetical protein